jgi:hypothetical protein
MGIPPEGLQAHQGLISGAWPKLARPMKPDLILSTGRFHRATSQRLPMFFSSSIVESVAIVFEAVSFDLQHGSFGASQLVDQTVQLMNDLHGLTF